MPNTTPAPATGHPTALGNLLAVTRTTRLPARHRRELRAVLDATMQARDRLTRLHAIGIPADVAQQLEGIWDQADDEMRALIREAVHPGEVAA